MCLLSKDIAGIENQGAGEMSQWLRPHIALLEDMNSLKTTQCNSSSSLWSLQKPHT